MEKALSTLLEAAVLAPSGDNTQPWRFEWSPVDACLSVCVDDSRDRTPMNAGQRMARHACGAALENIVRTASHNRWRNEVSIHDDPIRIASVKLDQGELHHAGEIDDAIKRRHTNRKMYSRDQDFQPPAVELSPEESECAAIEWVTQREAIDEWAGGIGQLDVLMFQQPGVLRAFLANVRFDRPANEAVDHGLSVGSLEVARVQAAMLPHMQRLPERLITSAMVTKPLGKHSRELVASAAGICVISTEDAGFRNDVVVGRLMQRAWLALTEVGAAVQPMMSLPVLSSMSEHDQLPIRVARSFQNATDRLGRLKSETDHIRSVLRFGFTAHPTTRTGRLTASLAAR